MERYHTVLCKEIIDYSQRDTREKNSIQTVFIGGGTPSTYPPTLLLDMFATLRNMMSVHGAAEITLEVNPGTVSNEKLETWKRCGINRLSIGVQSLKDSVLHSLNRKQAASEVVWLLEHAKDLFDNISVDLIIGLPGITSQEWYDLLATVVTWPITHVSIYFLTVHEDTQLYFKVKKSEVVLPPDDAIVDLYLHTISYLAEHGFVQYEVSNFCKPGFESRHNSVYWERKPYKGFGLGACSFDGQRRFQQQKNLIKYMDDIESNRDTTIFSELLSEQQIVLEKVMLALRRMQGISYDELLQISGGQKKEKVMNYVATLTDNQFATMRDNQMILTPKGLAVQNYIVTQLMS